MNQAALPMITSSPTFDMIHLFDWKILPIRFVWIICFLCMYIRKFTKYTNVCVCVCVHESERLPIKLCCNLLLGGLHAPYFWSSMICNHFLQTKWRLLAKWRLILPICFHKLLDTAVWRAAVQLRGGHFETSPLCTTFWPLQKNLWSPWCFARSVWGKCCTSIYTVAQT